MRRGFTLVELLVVVAIIAILAGLMLPVLCQSYRSARVAAAQQSLTNLSLAISAYAGAKGVEPPGDGRGSRALLRALAEPGSRHAPYYVPKEDEVTAGGDLLNPVRPDDPEPLNLIHYRRDVGLEPGPRPGQPPVRRGIAYQLWCAGLGESPWELRAP